MPDLEDEAASAEREPTRQPDVVQTTINQWLDDFIRNSPVSRATEAWNHLINALPALAAALKKDL